MKRWAVPITRPRAWWRSLDDTTRKILYVLAIAALITALPAAALSGDWSGLFLNLGTELAGGAVTFVLLDQVLGTSRRKRELIAQMGSSVNDEAIRAVEDLRRHGWLYDGSLNGANLFRANLKGASLWNANLAGANLFFAELEGASLFYADMEGANLSDANLKASPLGGANLKNANLFQANLEGALLQSANLKGAELLHANLHGAEFGHLEIEGLNQENTILPNGDTWHPGYDMTIFTNPPDGDASDR